MKVLILCSIFILDFGFVISNVDCDWKAKQRCSEPLKKQFNHPEDLFQTEDELKESCTSFFSTLQCLENYMNACPENVYGNKTFEEEFGKISSLIDELCTEGSAFRNDYLRYSPCLKPHAEEIRDCHINYDTFKTIFGDWDLSLLQDEDDLYTIQCMDRIRTLACILKTASDSCGIGAASVFRRSLIALEEPTVGYCFDL